jgi:multidrug efflux pump subunit AcrA (membrane-fusion protein)
MLFKAFKKYRFTIQGRLNKKTTLVLALLGLLFLCWIANALYQRLSKLDESEQISLTVQTVKVKEGSMPEVIKTIGSLTAKNELKIKAGGSGRIQQLLVESGSWVKSGTLLANIIAAPEVRATFDGYLTDWLVKPGEYVTAGTELVDLVNTDLLSLTYRVPEQYAGKLDLGQPVEVSVKAFPDKIFKGEVHFISPIIDKKTYTILMKAEVKNPDQDLWPGMSAHVQQILTNHPQALVIPEACLILTMEGYQVFVVKEGKIEKRTIKIGERRGGRVHVLEGVELGEPVVLARTSMIEEGASAVAHDWTGDW